MRWSNLSGQNPLRRSQEGVLLLDEVEKAHPSILAKIVLPLIGEAISKEPGPFYDSLTRSLSIGVWICSANLCQNIEVFLSLQPLKAVCAIQLPTNLFVPNVRRQQRALLFIKI